MRTARRGVLGTIAAPDLAGDVTTRVAEELAEDLARSYGAVGWRTVFEVDRLVEPPALTTDLIDAARRKLLERGWDLASWRSGMNWVTSLRLPHPPGEVLAWSRLRLCLPGGSLSEEKPPGPGGFFVGPPGFEPGTDGL